MTSDFRIGTRSIGPGQPVYVIAEISANHNQDFDAAVKLVHAAHDAGADAVKLQTYTADTITLRSNREWFQIGGGTLWDGKTLYDLYKEAYTPWDWQPKLKNEAERLGLDLFSSPFDDTAVDFLEEMDVHAYKIASFELVDIPLIRKVAQTGKPIIISTGMASHEEIKEALATARSAGARDLALLKCTSAYPAPPESMNLRTIPAMASDFSVPVGLSDHTIGIEVPVAAVALGAAIVEKHITLSRSAPGPDSAFSLEPGEFKTMVSAIRATEKALGIAQFGPGPHERSGLAFRRSLFIAADIKRGEKFTPNNLRAVRPSHGLHTRYYEQVLGKSASGDFEAGTPLRWDMIEGIKKDGK